MKILGPLFFSIIIIIIYTYLLIKYWKLLNLRDLKYKKFLFILRLVLLSLIIILIIDPFIEKNWIEKKKPEVGIVFDLSESISKHLDGNIQVIENVRKYFDKWALENNYLLNFYKLDEKIKFLKNYDMDAVNTSFMDIPGFIDRNNFREIFLVTDGIATSGKYIADINYDSSIPINLIGIGPYNLKQDLKIEKVILPYNYHFKDTINIKVIILSALDNDCFSELYLKNELNKEVYSKEIFFQAGNQIKELSIQIPVNKIIGRNEINLVTIDNEEVLHNNKTEFHINPNDNGEILFISGSLSLNTNIYKKLLNRLPQTTLFHYYKTLNYGWSKIPNGKKYNNLKLIILDDYPSSNSDLDLFNDLVDIAYEKNIPIVYLEGPSSNIEKINILKSRLKGFTIKRMEEIQEIELADYTRWIEGSREGVNSIPPQKRKIKWYSENSLVMYKDSTTMVGNNGLFYYMSLPALSNNYYKTLEKGNSFLDILLYKVFKNIYYNEDGIVNIALDRNIIYKGGEVIINYTALQDIDITKRSAYYIYSGDTTFMKCDFEYRNDCVQTLYESGVYTFFNQGYTLDGKLQTSNGIKLIVRENRLEYINLVQDHKGLKLVANKTDGEYVDLDSLELFLSNKNINQEIVKSSVRLSSISLQNYWWLIILFLCVEWYFRKKVGLL